MRHTLLVVLLTACLGVQAFAKGGMYLHGTISDVKTESDLISFRFTGKIIVEFRAAPKFQKPQKTEWEVEKALIQVPKWKSEYEGTSSPPFINFTNAVRSATARAKDGKETDIGLIQPAISFSDDDDTLILRGTHVAIGPPFE